MISIENQKYQVQFKPQSNGTEIVTTLILKEYNRNFCVTTLCQRIGNKTLLKRSRNE